MKTHGFAVKLVLVCAWLLAGYFLFPENSSAQFCPYSWPTINVNWGVGPDNYYSSGSAGGWVVSTCTACACEPISAACGGWIPFMFSTSSVGAGLMALGAELDYAVSPETGLGGIQRITLKKKF